MGSRVPRRVTVAEVMTLPDRIARELLERVVVRMRIRWDTFTIGIWVRADNG